MKPRDARDGRPPDLALRRDLVPIEPPAGLSVTPLGGDGGYVLSYPLAVPALPPVLSTAERDVARLAISGLTNAQIAHRRGCSPRTVANQLAKAFRKLGVGSRGELAARFAWLDAEPNEPMKPRERPRRGA